MSRQFRLLFQDERIVVIDKPSGFHVHPPESGDDKVPRHKIVLHQLRDQIGKRVYPVHRLDASTSGVLLFALDSEAAGLLAQEFAHQRAKKDYQTVVRGYLPDEGEVAQDLDLDSTGKPVPALTTYKTIASIERTE